MRIVFVQAGLGAGGAEKVVNLLATHRAAGGDDVRVLALGSTPENSYFRYPDSIKVETSPADRSTPLFRIPQRARWLRQCFIGLEPDLIVSFLTKPNVLTLLASRGLNIPVVISERNNPLMQAAHPLWRPANLLLSRAAACLVMQTDAARSTLPRRLRDRAVVIPNPSVLPPQLQRRDSDEGGRIVAVGRLDRQKGFDMLLEAFARILTEARPLTLTIFGEGQERGALEKQARRLGIAQRVEFPGTTSSPGAWLAAADVFVLSSRFEGFPNVLVEALAAGLAVVAFDCPWGPSSILTHEQDGLLVSAEDIDALGRALQRVTTDADLRRALMSAAPRAVKRFDLPIILSQWDVVFERAVRGNQPNCE